MSEPVLGVVVSHGGLAEALVNAVSQIVGPDSGLVAVSNEGCSARSLTERILTATGKGPCVLFVDMAGGSCFMAAARCIRSRADVSIISGVNLPMLLEFAYHRSDDVHAITQRLMDAGSRSIRTIPT